MVTAFSWPNFIYDGYKCDPFDLEKGLFRSAMLLKASHSAGANLPLWYFDAALGIQGNLHLAVVCKKRSS
jgi:hypothetical protein